MVKNLQQIRASSTQILRMSDRWMRAFSVSHAPATRRKNLAASECFCSDAGRSFAALRVGRAENLQRFGNMSLIKKVTQEFLKGEGGSEGFV